MLYIHLDGDPRPCPRPRVSNRRAYYPAWYEAQKAAWALEARYQVSESGGAFANGERLAVLFEFHRATNRTADADNLSKAAADAINGVGWQDDAQIDDWRVVVRRGVGIEAAGVDVWIWELPARWAFVPPDWGEWVGV